MPGPAWQDRLAKTAESSPWRWTDVLHILFLLAGAQLVRIYLPEGLIWDVVCFHGPLLAGIGWRAKGKVRPFGKALPLGVTGWQAFRRWITVLPILWVAALGWQMILRMIGYHPDLQHPLQLFMEMEGPLRLAAFLFFALIIAPIVEESLFRGILQPLLVRRFGPVWGLVLIALGFGAIHADVGTFVSLAVFSVALSLAVAQTGSLRVAILMHALFNGVNLLLLTVLIRAGVV